MRICIYIRTSAANPVPSIVEELAQAEFFSVPSSLEDNVSVEIDLGTPDDPVLSVNSKVVDGQV